MQTYFNLDERLKKIFNYFSIFTIVLGTTFGALNMNVAYAGDGDEALTEVADGATVNADDVVGLLETTDGATGITVDPDGDITLGATGDADAITVHSDGDPGATLTVTVTDSDTDSIDTLTIAGDLDVLQEATDSLILNVTNADVLIQNNVSVKTTNLVDINLGSGGDVTLTIDHDVDQAQEIEATIDGNATNTVTLAITETTATAQSTRFGGAIGATTALDAININPTDDETVSVKFQAAVSATAITLGDATDAADDATSVTFEAQAADYTVTGTINNAVAADETTILVTDATDGAAPDTVTFASNIGSTIAVDAISVGTTDVGGDAIFNGDVSTTALTVLGGDDLLEASVADFNGDLTAAVTLDKATGDATLTLSGTSAQTVTGAINGNNAVEGNISITNTSGVTFETAIGGGQKIAAITTGTSAVASFDKAIATDTLTVGASSVVTVSENANVVDGVGDWNLTGDGATIIIAKTVVDTETVFDTTDVDALDIHANAKIYMPVNMNDTDWIRIIDNSDGGNDVIEEFNDIIQDTALIDFTAADEGGADQVKVTAANKSSSTTATELSVTNNAAVALMQAFEASIDDTNVDSDAEDAFNNALNALNGQGTTADTDLALQVTPQDDMISGSTFATKAMTGSLQGIMSNRMAALRSGDAYYGSGMSAGSLSKNSGFIQVFGSDVEQKNKTVGSGTQFGYDASSTGVALGFDGITDNGSVVGLSLSMSETDVDGKGTGNSKNDIDSYTASIYMDKSTDAGYIEGSLTIGMNENSTSRIVNTAGLDRTYKGVYDSYQASLNLSGGVPNDTGNGFVTPFGGVSATQIQTERYRETSSTAGDNLRLTVDQDDVTSIVGTVGVKYHNVLDNGGVPMISLAINNEFGDNTIESTNTYQGGGTSFKTSTDVEELSATLGLGYTFASDNASLELSYEADANDDDYLSHYGSIKIVGKF